MKASIVEVHDMLSALSVLGVEKRIGEVLGVESVRVNYAAAAACACDDSERRTEALRSPLVTAVHSASVEIVNHDN